MDAELASNGLTGPALEPPRAVGDVTARWMSAALGIDDVGDVSFAPIGTGQVADTVRVTFGAQSCVVKVPAASPASMRTARSMRSYEIEAGFYRDLAPLVGARVPACRWAGHDPETGAYAVVLEDLVGAAAGDQLTGCTADDGALAVDELALLHAHTWGASAVAYGRRFPWLRADHRGGPAGSGAMPGFTRRFVKHNGEHLAGDVVGVLERFAPAAQSYACAAAAATAAGPGTAVVHRDFRTDNLLFPSAGGDGRVCVVDWQTAGIAPALADLSYFLGGSLTVDDRRRHETDLVRAYHARLVGAGVELTWDECWRGYRRHAFDGIVMAVLASCLVAPTDRGDAMFRTMVTRAALHALDLESTALLPAAAAGGTLR